MKRNLTVAGVMFTGIFIAASWLNGDSTGQSKHSPKQCGNITPAQAHQMLKQKQKQGSGDGPY